MLKFIIAALADAAAEHQPLYKEVTLDGKQVFQLQVEGAVPTKKLDEFRDNNKALNAELVAYKGLGLTPEQIKELNDNKANFEQGKLVEKGKLEEVRTAVAAALTKTHETEKAAWTAEKTAYEKQVAHLLITQESQRVAAEMGFRVKALPDVGMFAERTFRIVDGKPVAVDPATGKDLVAADGYSPLSMKEFLEGVAKDKPYMLEENKGGGAGGSGGKQGAQGADNGVNPFKKDTLNRSAQALLYKTDYPKYQRLALAAGVTPLKPPQS